MTKPSWCAKPRPCDYDERSAYCPHRECRQNIQPEIERLSAENEAMLDVVRADRDYYKRCYEDLLQRHREGLENKQ